MKARKFLARVYLVLYLTTVSMAGGIGMEWNWYEANQVADANWWAEQIYAHPQCCLSDDGRLYGGPLDSCAGGRSVGTPRWQ